MKGNTLTDHALIDAHAHLETIEPVEKVIQRARFAGIKQVVAVGMDLDSNIKTLDIAGRFPGTVLPAIGYHPWRILAEDVDRNLAFIESQLSQCVALGEVGLDYKVKVKKPLQWDVFSRVLNFAVNQKKPVIVHSRFSYQRSFQMVSAAGVERAVFHWYSGPLDILEEIIHKGYYISATPALAYSRFHQAAVKKAPLERILVETDSPVAYQGKKSEPVNLIDTLKSLSLLKGMPVQKVADITTENAGRFFGC
jgi:TatD DNase family protein